LEEVGEEVLGQYGDLLSHEPLKASIEVKRGTTRETASRLLKELPVDDLDIAETPIEEIIGEIFESTSTLVS